MPKKYEYTDTELLDKTAEVFHQEVYNDDILDLFVRGLIGPEDCIDRLKHIKVVAERRAEGHFERLNEDSFEREEAAS